MKVIRIKSSAEDVSMIKGFLDLLTPVIQYLFWTAQNNYINS